MEDTIYFQVFLSDGKLEKAVDNGDVLRNVLLKFWNEHAVSDFVDLVDCFFKYVSESERLIFQSLILKVLADKNCWKS